MNAIYFTLILFPIVLPLLYVIVLLFSGKEIIHKTPDILYIKIGEYFGHFPESSSSQYMWPDFLINIHERSKDLIIEIPNTLPVLKRYELHEHMSDYQLQQLSSSQTMNLKNYWLAYYMLLTIKNASDKYETYIMHVEDELLGDKPVSVYFQFLSSETAYSNMYEFGQEWPRRHVYMYF